MPQYLSAITLLVSDYDVGISFYAGMLGFELIEDRAMPDGKRWVLVAPPGSREARLLLAKAAGPAQVAHTGDQTGGRVAFFLTTDDFARDHAAMLTKGVEFLEAPRNEAYGTVAVFRDPFGNKWDLLQPR